MKPQRRDRPGGRPGVSQSTRLLAADSITLRAAVVEAIAANELATGDASTAEAWRSVAWEFTRALRGHPELVDLDAVEAADALEAVFLDLGDALPYAQFYLSRDGLVDLPKYGNLWAAALGEGDSCGNDADAEQDFMHLWDRIDPDGTLSAAVARARRREAGRPADHYGADLAHPRRAALRLFLALCEELSRGAKGGAFPLAVEALAKALHTDRKCIGRWRQEAVERGFLVPVADAVRQRSAARYRLAEVDPWE